VNDDLFGNADLFGLLPPGTQRHERATRRTPAVNGKTVTRIIRAQQDGWWQIPGKRRRWVCHSPRGWQIALAHRHR
jgi:hypothetical protein